MNAWTGQDWAFLLGGVAVLFTALATGIAGLITAMVTLFRVGRVAETVGSVAEKVDGLLLQRDAANRKEGEIIGRQAGDEAAEQRAEGRRQERVLRNAPGGNPVAVADDRTAVAAERGAAANERIADAAEKK